MVTFGVLNLAQNGYPSQATDTEGMDVILCRNVLMYFSAEQGRAAARRLQGALGRERLAGGQRRRALRAV